MTGTRLPMMDFVKRVHFVGIGGVGMSGIARVLLNLDYKVSGSDLKATELTRSLGAAGAKVRVGHRASNVRGADVVVVSSAVDPANPEVRAARAAGIPVARRVEMLAEIGRMKKTVTVSGTHGKTTTTAMVAMALESAGTDPTAIVGGQVAHLGGPGGSNARLGLGEYLVAEADESDGSFLKLTPLVAVVTNIDDDHLDYYGSFGALKKAFLRHLQDLPFYGTAVLCSDDSVVRGLLPKVGRPVLTYGFQGAPDWKGRLLGSGSGARTRMEIFRKGRRAGVVELRVPGRHNALNALAAVAVGEALSLPLKGILAGLARFAGVGRRMELLGKAAGVSFYDDYGHHPTEIAATLQAMRELVGKGKKIPPRKGRTAARRRSRAQARGRLIVIFQPHRFSRTRDLHKDFGPALKGADAVHVMSIYPAGEKPLKGVSSELILRAARKSGVPAQAFSRAVDLVRDLRAGDTVLTLGAGDVWKIGIDLLRRLKAPTLA